MIIIMLKDTYSKIQADIENQTLRPGHKQKVTKA